MALTILGILLVFVGFIVFAEARIPISGPDNAFSPASQVSTLPLLFAEFVAVIVQQFAARRTALARCLLVAAVIIFLINPFGLIASSIFPIDRVFPVIRVLQPTVACVEHAPGQATRHTAETAFFASDGVCEI